MVDVIKNWRKTEDYHPMPHAGGTIPLAPGPGTLVRIVFLRVLQAGLAPATDRSEAGCLC